MDTEEPDVPISYQSGESFQAWGKDRKISLIDTLIPSLIRQREALLKRIDFNVWDSQASRKLDLMDYLLGN